LSRIVLAFRCFFALLFRGALSPELTADLGLAPKEATPAKPSAPPPPAFKPSDGALQMLGILQRDSRIVDFLMEDISSYEDEQVGAAVRAMQTSARDALVRYVSLEPIVDGVEGTFTKPPSNDPAVVKYVGNVPAAGANGGTLRHRGWRATSISLPPLNPRQDNSVIAPAEIEVE
jgi:Domain of unknown function (DUF2760)